MTRADELIGSLQHADHRQLFEYWQSKATPSRLPGRADIDPVEMRNLLPRLALIDVVHGHGKLDFRYRLTGTEIVERAGRDPTGKSFQELYSGDYLETAIATYRQVVETGKPILSERTFPLVPGREFLRYDRLILPLASDGETVDMIILLVVVLEHCQVDEL